MNTIRPTHRNLGPIAAPKTSPLARGREQMRRDGYHNFAGASPDRDRLGEDILLALAGLIDKAPAQSGNLNTLNPGAPPEAGTGTGKIGGVFQGLAAGYTYLFQLAAHDLVNTRVTGAAEVADDAPLNLRRQPLALQSVMGEGVLSCPYAYAYEGRTSPRLRLGQVRQTLPKGGWDWSPPARDLPRGRHSPDGQSSPGAGLDIALIPDARNDDNMILAQLTALFHGLANHVLATVETAKPALLGPDPEGTAQRVLVLLWRRILRDDLLARLLHPRIHALYKGRSAPRVDTASPAGRPSIEFAFAAGRLGHALVRDRYQMNRDAIPLLDTVIQVSSSHSPDLLPMPKEYLIDWDLLFPPLSGAVPEGFNCALRFGPHSAAGLQTGNATSTTLADGSQIPGTTFRDLMREDSGGLASVHRIIEKVMAHWYASGWGNLFDPMTTHDQQREIVKKGLDRLERQDGLSRHAELTKYQRDRVICAPPLSLFLQFEAQQLGDDGRTLGPLGSILLAEGFWAAFEDRAAGPYALAQLEELALGAQHASMPALLAALRSKIPDFFAT